jgi:predicted Holliday junction resolvase-like endonuclease
VLPLAAWRAFAETAGIACVALLVVLIVVAGRLRKLLEELADERYQNRSLSSTYGRITEQWFPLMESYPYDPQFFRFLGSPVDGVQFEEDRIVFIEFKANRSRLSKDQKRFRRLVEEGQVYWDEFHFRDESGGNDEE